ncbi:MAG: hypothetical protein NWE81_02205 [Candidatus Bathyarchaeota archaeon]|jgi:predicted transcriptional regulator|nr:hypothetical protein [Candidatus Bathyarchaeota archaeon]
MISPSFVLSDGEKRRGHTEIVTTILVIAKDGELSTNIAKKARLNAQQLNLYMKKLVKVGLIEVMNHEGEKTYIATEKGNQFLRQYCELREIIHSNCDAR